MEGLALLAMGLVLFILVGSALGVVSFLRSRQQLEDIAKLRSRIHSLELLTKETGREVQAERKVSDLARDFAAKRVEETGEGDVAFVGESPEVSKRDPEQVDLSTLADSKEETVVGIDERGLPLVAPPPLPPEKITSPTTSPRDKAGSLEFALGAKWMGWVGAIMLLVGIGFLMKLAYDRSLIPPELRLAIGMLAGLGALGVGEYMRRKDGPILFQTLTGCGIGILYLCVFFSYRIYELTGPGASMALGVLVTVLGVVMAVAHDALPIAVLALLGGFLSPILFSAGGNHPYQLFSYIAVLDLAALGAAYYRRWRALNLLCFAGTLLLYQAWYVNNYDTTTHADRPVALLFTTIFYLMFLLIPTLFSLVRKVRMNVDSLTLIVVNALFSLYAYYELLYDDYRQVMGMVVIGQAALIFVLFQLWSSRVSRGDRTAESLLIITLSLVTLAIPIQLRLYGIPIGWAVEGALFVFLGLKFKQHKCVYGGVAAFVLSAVALFYYLPLHALPFTPVFNRPFGSWSVVIAALVTGTVLLHRSKDSTLDEGYLKRIDVGVGVLACVLFATLLTLEVATYWDVHAPEGYRQSRSSSLMFLWTCLPTVTTLILWRRRAEPSAFMLAWVAYGFGALVFLSGLDTYRGTSTWLMVNKQFPTGVLFIVSAIWAGWIARRQEVPKAGNALETCAQVLLVLLLAEEFSRWGKTPALSRELAGALLSCAWALQAFTLIWRGLASRIKLRRILGFMLFALTVAHVVYVALEANLDPAMQIISFIGSGLLLLGAAAFYSRFRLLFSEEEEADREGD